MDTEIEILMEQNKKQAKRMDDMREQLDKDRQDIDQIRIDQQNIKNGQEAILKQMTDFKAEIRQAVKDSINEELPKAVKKAVRVEWDKMVLENPKKAVVRDVGFVESIKKLLKIK